MRFIKLLIIIFLLACKNDNIQSEEDKFIDSNSILLKESNFYEFIKQFEYKTYHENGNIKEYNYVSPKSADTLFRFFYDEEGKPYRGDRKKKKIYS